MPSPLPRLLCTALFAATLAASSPAALAHGAHDPLYGGVTAEADHLSFELVGKDDGAHIYVMDHDDEHDASNMKGKLTILKGRDKTEAEILPVGGNQLHAKGVQLTSGDKVVAALQSGENTYTVRFVVK